MLPSDADTGTESLAKMFQDRCEEKEVQNDVTGTVSFHIIQHFS